MSNLNNRLSKLEMTQPRHKPRTFVIYDGAAVGDLDGQPLSLVQWQATATDDDIQIVIAYEDKQPQSTITAGNYSTHVGIDAGKI